MRYCSWFMILIMMVLTGAASAQQIEIVDLGVYGSVYDIARDNNDGVHMIWKSGRDLFYARIENGVVQGRQQLPFDSYTYPVNTRWARPRISVRPDGKEVHTCWIYKGSGASYFNGIYYMWRDANGTWRGQTAYLGPTNSQFVAFPQCGVDLTGTVHMIAQRHTGGNGIIYGRKPVGGGWSWTSMTGSSPEWRHCTLNVAPDGSVHATWKAWQYKGQYRYCGNGGNLAYGSHYTIPIAPWSVANSMGDTFIGDNGTAHHVFISYNSYTVDYSSRPSGGNFGAVSQASDGNFAHVSDYDHHADIAADNNGNVVATWAEEPTRGRISRVVVAWKTPGGWQEQIIDDNANINEFGRPALTVTGKGGYLVWRDINGYLKLAYYGVLEDFIVAGYSASYVNGSIGEDTDFLVYKLDPLGSKVWRRNLGGDGNEEAMAIDPTADNGYIVAGWTDSYVNGDKGDTDFLVYKLFPTGKKSWRKNYGGDYPDGAFDVEQTSDGGYVIAGGTASYVNGVKGSDSDFLVYKVNAAGSKAWRKNFGGDMPEVARSIRQTSDGGYIVAGETQSYVHGTEGEDTDFLVYKLNKSGSKVWRKNYGGEHPDVAYCVQQTSDGGYVVAGETQSYVNGGEGDTDFLIYKINAAGTKTWRKNFGGAFTDAAYSIIQTQDGGYIVAGETQSYVHGTEGEDTDFLVYKLNGVGNKSWRQNYGDIQPDTAYSIKQTSAGNYIVVGETRSYVHGGAGEDADFLVYKIDTSGQILWQKNYGGDYPDGARAVK